jgi:parallel beta-helix repeat protein
MRKILSHKRLVFVVIVSIVAGVYVPNTFDTVKADSIIIYVDDIPGSGPDNPPENYTSIQDAIDNANTGDTVFVYSGTYYEHVGISNNGITILGEYSLNTIIEVTTGESAITILNTNNISISELTVKCNDLGTDKECFCIVNCTSVTVKKCLIDGLGSANDGIGAWDSEFLVVDNNTIYNTDFQGIRWENVDNSIITNNVLEQIDVNAIQLVGSSNNNRIYQNEIKNVGWYCIRLGRISTGAHNMFFHNNFLGATCSDETGNINYWNDSYPSGGNYWDDYTGKDNNSDGIGDTSYNLAGNQDRYPLVHPYDSITNLVTGEVFLTIQDAIEDTDTLDSHTIFVRNGIYYEHVIVNKTLRLTGENSNATIIDGGGYGNVLHVTSDFVNISNLYVRKCGSNWDNAGIIINSDCNTIKNNNICHNNNFGLWCSGSSFNSIFNNNMSSNDNEGISFYYTSHSIISDNTICSNNGSGINLKFTSNNNTINGNIIQGNHFGIYLLESWYNNIIQNSICQNNGSGIWITQSSRNHIAENEVNANEEHGIQITDSSNYNFIQENSISDNIQGIRFIESVFNTIQNNRICSNLDDGIALNEGSGLNRIIGNYIFNNVDDGIQIYHSSDNNITDNNITTNWERGIQITGDSYNNIIYHNNFFDNAVHGYDEMPNNWDNGYPSGGNYWDGYTGMDNYHGPNQDIPGPDGFIDIPYDISGGDNKDCYPLKDILKGSIPELPTKAHMGIIPSAETVLLGEKFTVTVYIDPIEEIGGWEVNQLNFTQGLVNAQDVIPGSSWNTIFDNGTINNENGEITGVQAWRTSLFPYTNHTACTVNYTTVQPGECDFALLDVTVTDSTFKEIDVITHDTAVNIITKPTIRNEYTENRSKGWGRGHNGYRPPYNLSAYVEDLDGDSLSITIQWYVPTHCYFKPDVNPCPEYEHRLVTVASFNGVGDGRYEFVPTGNSTLWFNDWVWGNTTYYWNICVTDGTFWANKTFWYHTGGSRYDVNNDGIVNFIDAGKVWVHRDSVTCYDGLYDVNQDCRVNFVDAGLTWVNRD